MSVHTASVLMRRLRLSTLLLAINVGLLLLAVGGVAFVAVRLLGQLADEQALARVRQAGSSAQQAFQRSVEEIQTAADLLAERPTLRRLLREDGQPELQNFLQQFQRTSQLDGAAVLNGKQIIAESGAAIDLPLVSAGADVSGVSTGPGGVPMLHVQAEVAELQGRSVVVTRLLDQDFIEQVSTQIGLPVRVVTVKATSRPLQELYDQVSSTHQVTALRIGDERYLAVAPLEIGGSPALLLEVELPATSVAQSLDRLIQTLVLLTVGVVTCAALASLFVGRRLGRPLESLTVAAADIGRGRLATPIPQGFGAEVTTLAQTLDEMRGQIDRLTTDLRRQQAEADAILTGITEGVFTVDNERIIRYANPQTLALLGIGPEEVVGRFCGDVLNPQGRDGIRPCERDCPIIQARKGAHMRATEHLLLRNGEVRTVVITSAPIAEGRQVQVMRDETEVEASRRLRDAVFANISHEFRTPLSAQLASIELLLHQLPDLTTDQIGQLVLSLHRGTLRLTQLIDNLLESVRIEVGERSVRRHPVALDDVVEEALELTRPLLGQRRQGVVLDLPYPLPLVIGDSQRLTQVFVNLLANANKYGPANSTIRIGGGVSDDSVTLWVEDEGPGLPATPHDSLFHRFVRAPNGEPDQNGMGLGLAIVKSIVERHGGRVEASSGDNKTQMRVILPRQEALEQLQQTSYTHNT